MERIVKRQRTEERFQRSKKHLVFPSACRKLSKLQESKMKGSFLEMHISLDQTDSKMLEMIFSTDGHRVTLTGATETIINFDLEADIWGQFGHF